MVESKDHLGLMIQAVEKLTGNKFYFRTELGYGFGNIPQEILVTGTINDTPVQGIKEVPDVPGISENGYPLFNIGVGFSF